MPSFTLLLQTIEETGEALQLEATEDWSQGRTLYGGLSAALCLEAARRRFPDLPPLRAGQFTFAGPANGLLRMRPEILRQGRSTAIVGVDMTAAAGLAVRAVLTFGAMRQSALDYVSLPAPETLPPADCPNFAVGESGPTFFRHFEVCRAGGSIPVSGAAVPEFLLWVRHRDAAGVDPLTGLLALADAPPPAALAMFDRFAPISTMTWAVNVVGQPEAADWHLISTRAENIKDGYSSQRMVVWGRSGAPLIAAQQNVAVFI